MIPRWDCLIWKHIDNWTFIMDLKFTRLSLRSISVNLDIICWRDMMRNPSVWRGTQWLLRKKINWNIQPEPRVCKQHRMGTQLPLDVGIRFYESGRRRWENETDVCWMIMMFGGDTWSDMICNEWMIEWRESDIERVLMSVYRERNWDGV